MSELIRNLRSEFENESVRYAYTDAFINAYIAAQIKTLREDYPLSQKQLAEKIDTKQSGISRLENANYSSWKVATLRKLARALGVRLRISFEEFGTLIPEIEHFNKASLKRRRFSEDPIFLPIESQSVKRKTPRLEWHQDVGWQLDPNPDNTISSSDINASNAATSTRHMGGSNTSTDGYCSRNARG